MIDVNAYVILNRLHVLCVYWVEDCFGLPSPPSESQGNRELTPTNGEQLRIALGFT